MEKIKEGQIEYLGKEKRTFLTPVFRVKRYGDCFATAVKVVEFISDKDSDFS